MILSEMNDPPPVFMKKKQNCRNYCDEYCVKNLKVVPRVSLVKNQCGNTMSGLAVIPGMETISCKSCESQNGNFYSQRERKVAASMK